MKSKASLGFTPEKLNAAGISRKLALPVGIAVDHHSKNRSEESILANKERLLNYNARLIVLANKKLPFNTAKCFGPAGIVNSIPIPLSKPFLEHVPISSIKREPHAYIILRKQSGIARYFGISAILAAKKAKAAESKKIK